MRIRIRSAAIASVMFLLPAFVDAEQPSEAYEAAWEAIGRDADPGVRPGDACIPGTGTLDTHVQGYEGLPVKRCVYWYGRPNVLPKALVYTLYPTKEQLAKWVEKACSSISSVPQETCGKGLVGYMSSSNSLTYVVKGNFLELGGDISGCPDSGRVYNVQFRDGINVAIPNVPAAPGGDKYKLCWDGNLAIDEQEADAAQSDVNYYFLGRVAMIDLDDYERLTDTQVPTTTEHDDGRGRDHPSAEWGRLNRESYINAIKTGDYTMLDLIAKQLYGN